MVSTGSSVGGVDSAIGGVEVDIGVGSVMGIIGFGLAEKPTAAAIMPIRKKTTVTVTPAACERV